MVWRCLVELVRFGGNDFIIIRLWTSANHIGLYCSSVIVIKIFVLRKEIYFFSVHLYIYVHVCMYACVFLLRPICIKKCLMEIQYVPTRDF